MTMMPTRREISASSPLPLIPAAHEAMGRERWQKRLAAKIRCMSHALSPAPRISSVLHLWRSIIKPATMCSSSSSSCSSSSS
mmetsp:Transcript_17006/g.27654  ORF Transcript_17006/g.27654 Transcript_17006/m.27654 type:complete len:82 (+) Transcript_17006:561-806(+)